MKDNNTYQCLKCKHKDEIYGQVQLHVCRECGHQFYDGGWVKIIDEDSSKYFDPGAKKRRKKRLKNIFYIFLGLIATIAYFITVFILPEILILVHISVFIWTIKLLNKNPYSSTFFYVLNWGHIAFMSVLDFGYNTIIQSFSEKYIPSFRYKVDEVFYRTRYDEGFDEYFTYYTNNDFLTFLLNYYNDIFIFVSFFMMYRYWKKMQVNKT